MMQMSDPFIALVIDPIRSQISGSIELGCFRTCPEDQNPNSHESDMLIPEDKIKDFGAHFMKYYSLERSYFMNNLDEKIIEVTFFYNLG